MIPHRADAGFLYARTMGHPRRSLKDRGFFDFRVVSQLLGASFLSINSSLPERGTLQRGLRVVADDGSFATLRQESGSMYESKAQECSTKTPDFRRLGSPRPCSAPPEFCTNPKGGFEVSGAGAPQGYPCRRTNP